MSLLQWTEKLDVRVDKMNQEHVVLIDLMNTVFDANSQRASKAVISSALDELVNYVVLHFANEEAYMDSIGFEGVKTHKSIHKDLLKRVGGHVADYKSGSSAFLPDEFFEFLKFWLVSHIQGIDVKYSKHAN